ncbi:MAG: large subunit ribosomal protein L22 [Parcubacteria group bacterium Gr01-1014_30]|nr:MAG: large subunit ribosomal protein L22 [Parcubacteria group bacterium Gr01-1014_30]
MPVIAKLRYLRIAPRKVRLVVDLIRGRSVREAKDVLSWTVKKSSPVLLKLLNSAVASAKNQYQLEESDLYISKVTVDEGPKLKRFFPRARGSAYQIQKKTSHVTMVLDTLGHAKLKKRKKAEKTTQKERQPKERKRKVRPEIGTYKPKLEKGIKRIFRRKSF